MKRRPWLAALLSLPTPGLGHLYNGEPKKGALLFVSVLALSMVSLFLLLFLPIAPLNVFLPLALLVGWPLCIAVDAFRGARRIGTAFAPRPYNRWYVYVGVIILSGTLQTPAQEILKTRFVETYRIVQTSMSPTLLPGDFLLASKSEYVDRTPRRGELIVFAPPLAPNERSIMRVAGIPSDTLRMDETQLFVNEHVPEESYVDRMDIAGMEDFGPASYRTTGDSWGPLVVPDSKYFVLGDDRDSSMDSRSWGFVREEDILGKPVRLYFSWDPDHRSVRWDRIGEDLF